MARFNKCAPAIGPGGTIYAESGGTLYAVNSDGTIKWKLALERDGCSPIVGPDGIIYVGGGSKVYAISPNGEKRWEYETGYSITSIPTINSDERIYVGTDGGKVYAINPDGSQEWPFDITEKVSVQVDYIEEVPSAILHIFPGLGYWVTRFVVSNRSPDPVEITARSEIIGYTGEVVNRISLQPGQADTIRQVPQFKAGILEELTELKTADLYWKVISTSGGAEEILDEQTGSILLYARDTMTWCSESAEGEFVNLSFFIVAWVTPHVEEIKELISKAKEWHPEGRLVGYQGAYTEEEEQAIVWEQVKAIYHALKYEYDISYVNSPISYPVGTQRVRLPSESLKYGSANCIDGAVLFASALEAINIDPHICLVPGHAFVAWDWWEDSDYVGVFETTVIADYTADRANQIGIEEYNQAYDEGNLDLIPIELMRAFGLTPMEKPVISKMTVGQRKGVYSSPTIGPDGTIYFGSENGVLYAVSPSGQQRWECRTGGAVYSSPAVDSKGVIYVGSDAGILYAIYPNGLTKWEFDSGTPIWCSPAIDADGALYVGSDDRIYAIDSDGAEKWEFEVGEMKGSSPAIGPDGMIYIGSKDGLYAIAGKEGESAHPIITLSAASYNFGEVQVGAYAYWKLVVGNEGETRLTRDSTFYK